MKAVHRLSFFMFILWICVLYSCSKEQPGNTGNSYGRNYDPQFPPIYYVNIKRINNYPAGSKIVIERFGGKIDTSIFMITSRGDFFSKTLPFNDTTIYRSEVKNYSQYFVWKVFSAGNDSLSGGMTAPKVTGDNPIIFEIKY